MIINITSSPDIALDEIDTASQIVTERAHEDANIIWGATFDENMEDEMSVTVIATGFQGGDGEKSKGTLDVDMDLDDDDYLDAAPVAAPSAPSRSSRSSEPRVDPAVIDDDDTFTDIMSIFNRK